jgi:hypothetical protein
MRLERSLPIAALSLMAVWSIAVTVAVLRSPQISGDMAVGVVLGAVLLPVFLAACVLGLLVWPLIRLMEEESPTPSER